LNGADIRKLQNKIKKLKEDIADLKSSAATTAGSSKTASAKTTAKPKESPTRMLQIKSQLRVVQEFEAKEKAKVATRLRIRSIQFK
jgi:cell division septum initiation protein DivIVA